MILSAPCERRLAVLGFLFAAALAAGLLTWPWTGGEDDRGALPNGRFAVPRSAPDRVPETVTDLPDRCGVTKADLEALVPGAKYVEDVDGGCRWDSSYDSGSRLWSRLAIQRSVIPLSTALDLTSLDSPRVVTGLGDSALAHGSRTEVGDAVVAVSVRDSTFHVGYSVEERRGQPLEKTVMKGALRAAASFARGLGVPARPKLGDPVRDALAPAPEPEACGVVSRKMRERTLGAAGTAIPAPDVPLATFPEASAKACDLVHATAQGSRKLRVTIYVSREREPGSGTAAAARTIRMLHRQARGDGGLEPAAPGHRATRFQPIAGLGSHAFGGYWSNAGDGFRHTGRVYFQKHDTLVRVDYFGEDKEGAGPRSRKLDMAKAINGAYTVAVDIAANL